MSPETKNRDHRRRAGLSGVAMLAIAWIPAPATARDPVDELSRPPAHLMQRPPLRGTSPAAPDAAGPTPDLPAASSAPPASQLPPARSRPGVRQPLRFDRLEHLFTPPTSDKAAVPATVPATLPETTSPAPAPTRTAPASLDRPPVPDPMPDTAAVTAGRGLPVPNPPKPPVPASAARSPAVLPDDPDTAARSIPAALAKAIRIRGRARDPAYGHTPDAPIRLGGFAATDWAARRTLLALLLVSDRGAILDWQPDRTCCAFPRPGDKGNGRLVIYKVTPPGGRAFRLFVNHFDADKLYAPHGLGWHPSLTDRLAYAAAIASYNAGRLDEAFAALQPLAEAGHPLAQYYQASAAVGLGRVEALRRLYRRAADQGLGPAQFLYGIILADARTGQPDPAASRRWIIRAADGRNADARAYLGLARLDGANGFARDPAAGAFLLRLAAEQGQTAAQHDYGLARFDGHGVDAQPVDGLTWLVLAHRGGHPEAGAAIRTAVTRLGPRALDRAKDQADAWTRRDRPAELALTVARAARRGDPDAQARYARLLFNGVLTDRDLEAALLYFQLAARGGHAASARFARGIAAAVSADARARVRTALDIWQPEG